MTEKLLKYKVPLVICAVLLIMAMTAGIVYASTRITSGKTEPASCSGNCTDGSGSQCSGTCDGDKAGNCEGDCSGTGGGECEGTCEQQGGKTGTLSCSGGNCAQQGAQTVAPSCSGRCPR